MLRKIRPSRGAGEPHRRRSGSGSLDDEAQGRAAVLDLPPESDNAVSREALTGFIANLREDYDYAIVDAGTYLDSNSAMALTQLVDGILLTVRVGRASSDEDEMMVRMVEHFRGNVIGVVATDAGAIDEFARARTQHAAVSQMRPRKTERKAAQALVSSVMCAAMFLLLDGSSQAGQSARNVAFARLPAQVATVVERVRHTVLNYREAHASHENSGRLGGRYEEFAWAVRPHRRLKGSTTTCFPSLPAAPGFSAGHLVNALVDAGDRVVIIDNLSTGHVRNLEHALSSGWATFVYADVAAPPERLREIVSKAAKGKLERIFHFASPASPEAYGKDPWGTLAVNGLGTMSLIEVALEHRARLLFASTWRSTAIRWSIRSRRAISETSIQSGREASTTRGSVSAKPRWPQRFARADSTAGSSVSSTATDRGWPKATGV